MVDIGKNDSAKSELAKTMQEKDFDAYSDLTLDVWGGIFATFADFKLAMIWTVFIGYNKYQKYISDRNSLEFLKILQEGAFTDDDLKSQDFIEAIRRTFDAFSKERYEEKRKIIKNIFLNGFVQSKDRQKFRLERLIRALDGLETDDFIALRRLQKIVIKPNIEQNEKEYFQQQEAQEKNNKTLEQYKSEQAVNGYSFKREQYNEVVNGLLDQTSNLEREGIVHKVTTSVATFNGGSHTSYRITRFGLEFCKFLET